MPVNQDENEDPKPKPVKVEKTIRELKDARKDALRDSRLALREQLIEIQHALHDDPLSKQMTPDPVLADMAREWGLQVSAGAGGFYIEIPADDEPVRV